MANIFRIHPAIGIARLGDSADEYFVGPEASGVLPSLDRPDAPDGPSGRYKDDQGRIKRQGARFRVYEYSLDDAGATTKVREVTATEAEIEWEVHLANRKAAAPRFFPPGGGGRRNEEAADRNQLIIDAGPQKISGAEQRMKQLQGRFLDAVDVPLGDLLTDSAGRLIVLGGFGRSRSPFGKPLVGFADNDGWCDDTSDGPVRATIRLKGSAETVEADPAWVIVAPPDFAPPIENVVTLYDVVYNMMAKFVDPSLAVGNDTKVSFTEDVFPVFRRVSNLHWVSDTAVIGHGEGSFGHFISRVPELASAQPENAPLRKMIFRRLRNPKGGGGNMPKLPNDVDPDPDPNNTISLTEVQYERLKRWAEGAFEADWPQDGEPTVLPLDELPETEKPRAVDRAALEACVGGGFFPGIEVGRIMLEESTYDKDRPFRVSTTLDPGTLTARMAVPWQADFRDCSFEDGMDWWPGQRPNQVFRGQQRGDWIPPSWKPLDLVKEWSKLGFVVNTISSGRMKYVEDERSTDLQ
jgi:hypothetical protein